MQQRAMALVPVAIVTLSVAAAAVSPACASNVYDSFSPSPLLLLEEGPFQHLSHWME